MNISTGGPHILLFERDQQLATLLTSELQLAGYMVHTARTAVEVFDAIARHSVRLVLVNLAQAAAARREFWVALDTQRRDRKVQVMTFLCTNLAGYGPRDMEDRPQNTMADMEIDGMLGLMSLVDAVRTRVPSGHVESSGNTLPRMQKVSTSTLNTTAPMPAQRSTQPQPSVIQQEPAYRTPLSADTGVNQIPTKHVVSTTLPNPQPTKSFTAPSPTPSPATGLSGSDQPSYSEKIRAVLYPNQRTWNQQGSGSYSTLQEQKETHYNTVSTPTPVNTQQPVQQVPIAPSPSESALQRLASGQLYNDQAQESGLAQLSRMAQGFRSSPPEEKTAPLAQTEQNGTIKAYIPPTPRVIPNEEPIASQPLRASPILDIPIERTMSGPIVTDNTKRPDVLSRTNYSQQAATTNQSPYQQSQANTPSSTQPPVTPLASITASMPTISASTYTTATNTQTTQATPNPPPVSSNTAQVNTTPPPASSTSTPVSKQAATTLQQEVARIAEEIKAATERREALQAQDKIAQQSNPVQPAPNSVPQQQSPLQQQEALEESMSANNAVLLDIVQSLPPMPELAQPSSIQPQVLNGRATRALNKVLLDGHLVPQDRLEVAQNIQRMLRGVDLNYQLGEILLMFKLLTPDQLLAASLVSYGLINTNQISALGRIRQELHAIGLEYDLENLLVLFRILTPEQLREVRSNVQS